MDPWHCGHRGRRRLGVGDGHPRQDGRGSGLAWGGGLSSAADGRADQKSVGGLPSRGRPHPDRDVRRLRPWSGDRRRGTLERNLLRLPCVRRRQGCWVAGLRTPLGGTWSWESLSPGRTTALTLCGSRPAVRACSVSARPYSPVTRSSRLTRPEAARAIAVGHVLAYRNVPVMTSSRCWITPRGSLNSSAPIPTKTTDPAG